MFGGIAGLAVICFFAAIMLLRKRKTPRLIPWLMLFAGATLATAGVIGVILSRVADATAQVSGSVTGALTGTAVAALIAVLMTISLVIHMHPKKGAPTPWTPWVALVYPSVVAAAGIGAIASLISFGGDLGADFGTYALDLASQIIGSLR